MYGTLNIYSLVINLQPLKCGLYSITINRLTTLIPLCLLLCQQNLSWTYRHCDYHSTRTIATILRPLHTSTSINRHSHVRAGEFCCSEVSPLFIHVSSLIDGNQIELLQLLNSTDYSSSLFTTQVPITFILYACHSTSTVKTVMCRTNYNHATVAAPYLQHYVQPRRFS